MIEENKTISQKFVDWLIGNRKDLGIRPIMISDSHLCFFECNDHPNPCEEFRGAFMATLSDKELGTTDPEWIEYATVEFINRQAKAA